MRTLFILLALVLTGHLTEAQKITKAYGYWYTQQPGNIPVVPKEDNERNTPVNNRHESYFIYAEINQSQAPLIQSVYVRGLMFKATAVKLGQLPAEYEYYDGAEHKKTTLVPKGRKNVYIIVLGEYVGAVPYKGGVNDMTITYGNRNKSKWFVLRKMTELPGSVVP